MPELKLLMLSMYDSEQFLAGAQGRRHQVVTPFS